MMKGLDKIMSDRVKTNDPKKRLKLIFAAGILGILLILLSEIVPAKSDDEDNTTMQTSDELSLSEAMQYKESIEQELTDLISEIKGVGSVKVMVTLSGTKEYIYAEKTDVSEENDSQGANYGESREITLAEVGSDDSPIVKSVLMPEIAGASIVCNGADNAQTKEMVINAVAAALGLPTTKISVQPSD